MGHYYCHPVVDVTWYDATMFSEWVGASLPTEPQWEYGARGPEGRKYPWGYREPTRQLANFDGKLRRTTPVGAYPEGASWCGALDMVGNVDEWCSDRFGPYESTQTTSPTGPVIGSDRSVRGGSWLIEAGGLRAADRLGPGPEDRFRDIGFRVAHNAWAADSNSISDESD